MQRNESLKLLKNPSSCLVEHLVPAKISIRLQIKIGGKTDIFKTIYSTKGKRRIFKKLSVTFSSNRSP